MRLIINLGLVAIASITTLSFTPIKHNYFKVPELVKYDINWSQWQYMQGNQIRMRWGTDEYGEVSHQFRNDYPFEVHFWFRIDCTDGKTYSGNNIVDAGALTNSADQMKSKPSNWTILDKKKRVNGVWVSF